MPDSQPKSSQPEWKMLGFYAPPPHNAPMISPVSPAQAIQLLQIIGGSLIPKEKPVVAMAGPMTMYGLRAFLNQTFGPVMLMGCPVVEMVTEGFAITSIDHFTGS